MSRERGRAAQDREFRLEGAGLVLVVGTLVVLLGGAFWFGRWYERKRGPGESAFAQTGNPLAHVEAVEQAPQDVDASVDYFDNLDGSQKELEPAREMTAPPTATERVAQPAARRAPAPATRSVGDFYVQVFAGRDQSAAAGLVQSLEGGGYSVKLFSEREGTGTLYKVRVGGYESRESAHDVAQSLQGDGFAGAWVTRVE